MKKCNICNHLNDDVLTILCPSCGKPLVDYTLRVEGLLQYGEFFISKPTLLICNGYNVSVEGSDVSVTKFTLGDINDYRTIMAGRAKWERMFGIQLYRYILIFNTKNDRDYRFCEQDGSDKLIRKVIDYYDQVKEYEREIIKQKEEQELAEARRKEELLKLEQEQQIKVYKERLNSFKRHIESIAGSIRNTQILSVIENFAVYYESDILTYHVALASYLLSYNQISEKILIPYLETSASIDECNTDDKKTSTLINKFNMLASYINKSTDQKYECDIYYVTYVLLWKIMPKVSADIWIRKNPEYSSCTSLNLVIDMYIKSNLQPFRNANYYRFVLYLINHGYYEGSDYFSAATDVESRISEQKQRIEQSNFERMITSHREHNTFHKSRVEIEEIDKMTGVEFENLVENVFIYMGYSVQETKKTGDQGIDLIASKGKENIGIQAKRYNHTVGNYAIQEVVAGLKYYDLDIGIVVTNNYYTEEAKKLSDANHIILWDRDILIEKLRLTEIVI